PVIIPTEHMPWPAGQNPRLAGVSAFGFSGTNAHIIVEEAPLPVVQTPEVDRPVHILSLSAKSETALQELAGRYADYLATHTTQLPDAAFTANTGRVHHNHRAVVIAQTVEQMQDQLSAFAAGQGTTGVISHVMNSAELTRIAFLFT